LLLHPVPDERRTGIEPLWMGGTYGSPHISTDYTGTDHHGTDHSLTDHSLADHSLTDHSIPNTPAHTFSDKASNRCAHEGPEGSDGSPNERTINGTEHPYADPPPHRNPDLSSHLSSHHSSHHSTHHLTDRCSDHCAVICPVEPCSG
jgi:hypothetical protein